MTRIFATKVWGLGSETWGTLGFSKPGVRDALAGEFKPGDFVLYVGTHGRQTAEEHQGRLIGLVKVDSTHANTADLVEPETWAAHLRENGGEPKWPFGLPVTEAWRFMDDPLPEEKVALPRLTEGLAMKLATNYEELSQEEVELVLALPRERVEKIYRSDANQAAMNRQAMRAALRTQGSGRGPMPALGRREVTYSIKPAATYCMELFDSSGGLALISAGLRPSQLETRRVYKIGWSTDVSKRRGTMNFAFPAPALLGWRIHISQRRDSQLDAFLLEQAVLSALSSKKLPARTEMVACTPGELEAAFFQALGTVPPSDEGAQGEFVLKLVAEQNDDTP